MTSHLQGLRVLIVEDHDDSRESLRRLLLRHGADVVAVPPAEEALGLCTALFCDVIVSDLKLPGLDGYWLLAAVRAMEEGRDRSAFGVAYSGEAPAEASRALRHGFDYVVSKPEVGRLVMLLGSVSATLRTG